MPRLDGTGPEGRGPMTGRGLGRCEGAKNVTSRNIVRRGQGQGLGRGLGRARCPYWNTPADPQV